MGFLSKLFGGDSPKSSDYVVNMGSPSVETKVVLPEGDAKEAEAPDTTEYDRMKKRKRGANGVAGSFGWTQSDSPMGE